MDFDFFYMILFLDMINVHIHKMIFQCLSPKTSIIFSVLGIFVGKQIKVALRKKKTFFSSKAQERICFNKTLDFSYSGLYTLFNILILDADFGEKSFKLN